MPFPPILLELETAVTDACAGEEEWPGQVAAAIYAGVDFAIAHPEVADAVALSASPNAASVRRYELLSSRFAGHLRSKTEAWRRLPGSTDESLVAGILGLVGDHLRVGRVDRLEKMRPDLVLLTLLPYLGFEEARRWANSAGEESL